MKKLLLRFFVASVFLVSGASYALNNIDPANSIVKGYAKEGRPLKVKSYYKNNLNYYTDPALDNLTIEIDPTGKTGGIWFNENVSSDIHDALRMWSDGGGEVIPPFIHVQNSDNTSLGMWFLPSDDNGGNSNISAAAWFPGSIGKYAVFRIYPRNFITYGYTYDNLVDAGVFTRKDVTLKQYAQMLIKYCVIHEVGHILGLNHTNLSGDIGDFQVIPLVKANINDNPSIMMQSSTSYFKALKLRLGRTITADDIVLSENDKLAVRYQWAGITFRTVSILPNDDEL